MAEVEVRLVLCRCGKDAAFKYGTNEQSVYVECPECGMRTPSRQPSIHYSAKQVVADIWNIGETLWPRWIDPKGIMSDAYNEGDQVTHTARNQTRAEHWVSMKNGNIGEPGVTGWRTAGWAEPELINT